jgi:hypothetical protein
MGTNKKKEDWQGQKKIDKAKLRQAKQAVKLVKGHNAAKAIATMP